MYTDYNRAIINKNNRADIKEKFNNSVEWRNFATNITRVKENREFLFNKYSGTCQFCGKPLKENFVLHHVDYDHCCKTSERLEISTPTEKRPNAKRKVPPCVGCENREECLSRIVPVCCVCNLIIDNIYCKEHGIVKEKKSKSRALTEKSYERMLRLIKRANQEQLKEIIEAANTTLTEKGRQHEN